MKDLLIIFTRNPELGKCKTRLAAVVGDEAALDIYRFLLKHTVTITKRLDVAKEVYYSESITEQDVWPNDTYDKKLQDGNDLGLRMHNAFKAGFDSGFERIIIIGSDMFDLNQLDIEKAFEVLHENDYVIGPASDGGYYLLGMTSLNAELFQNKEWGTETVLEATLAQLEGKRSYLLPERNDIDRFEDIEGLDAFKPFLKHIN